MARRPIESQLYRELVDACFNFIERGTMTLKRNGVSREFTSDSLGHSDIRTTSHYLDSLSIDESFTVNNNLLKRKNRKAS